MATRYRLKNQQLAAELAKRRWSQNRWAQELGLGRGHLSLLLNGKRPYPSEATRRKLIDGLGAPFSTLFEVEEVALPGRARPRHLAWLPRRPGRGGAPLVSTFIQDLRYATRSLLQRPVLSGTVVLMLALGVGANSAMFSWINGILLDPLRVEGGDRWVSLTVRQASGFESSFSHPNFRDHRRLNEAFDDLHAFRMAPVSVSFSDGNQRALAGLASGNYFDMLGATAAIGRTFTDAEDEVPGRDAVAVLSHGFWQRHLGSDPDVVGREFLLNAHPFTVIGVMPADFGFARLEPASDLWVPLMMQEVVRPGSGTLEARGHGFLQVVARIPAGSDAATASEIVNVAHAQLSEQFPESLEGTSINLTPAAHQMVGGSDSYGTVSGVFWVLMGVVATVLLICCANVAGLLLARANEREREIGVRQALGASRGRLVRQLLTESVLLAGVAAVAGVAMAVWINRAVMSFQPPLPVPITLDVALDGPVLLFTVAAALATGLVFGVFPALRASRFELLDSLKGGDGRIVRGARARSVLVTSQIALSLMLLIGAGLFLRSLGNANSINAGFDADRILVAALDPGLQGYSDDEVRDFYRQLVGRLEAAPAVTRVATGEMLPMSFGTQQWGAGIEGYEPGPDERMNLDYNWISPGYFETMGIEVVAGREFDWDDTLAGIGAVIVNETMAARFWPGERPLGRIVRSGGMERQVVGIVRDAKYYSIGEAPMAYMYFPQAQGNQSAMNVHLRTDGDPLALVATLRNEVRALDAALPIFDVRTMRAQMGIALLPARMSATLLGIFGGFALLLAAVGLYGVMAYAVGQRNREIGIRMALGAGRSDVLRMVLRHAGLLAAIGVLLGLGGGAALGRVSSGLLYGVAWVDPAAFAGSVAVILAVGLLATGLPARRATRVDPVEALRNE